MSFTTTRFSFAIRYAWRHLLLSLIVGGVAAAMVFGWWYPMPYRAMVQVSGIFALLLSVDVVCGPFMTAVLANPKKSRRERLVDFALVGFIQMMALAYGLHSVWLARPVVLAFERDRLVVVTANEIDHGDLIHAPEGMRQLPLAGVQTVGIRSARNSEEFLQSVELGLGGVSPAMRPGWWTPFGEQMSEMLERAKPLSELIGRRPESADILRKAAQASGLEPSILRYLPLVSSKTKDWVALLDVQMNMVGYAPVDGF
ncbi:fimb protein [Vandammella animalimorsus]|uniref:Fimb protein n=1 Tax=Vandammella animalimorsus TaxID=2029117 RepID=A0A3M6RIJ5_9BURK|nr:fimb protein [Vandammella animalimorsus]RMX15070.1 fimb protein [Vandammella animalimorsus]